MVAGSGWGLGRVALIDAVSRSNKGGGAEGEDGEHGEVDGLEYVRGCVWLCGMVVLASGESFTSSKQSSVFASANMLTL